MKATITTKTGLKRIFGWIPEDIHAKAKSFVALSPDYQFLEEFVSDAIKEKLEREGRL